MRGRDLVKMTVWMYFLERQLLGFVALKAVVGVGVDLPSGDAFLATVSY